MTVERNRRYQHNGGPEMDAWVITGKRDYQQQRDKLSGGNRYERGGFIYEVEVIKNVLNKLLILKILSKLN